MKSIQRRRDLLAMIQQQGNVSVSEIARIFEVSKMTVHRDLEILEQRGGIRRIFGGAVPAGQDAAPAPASSLSIDSGVKARGKEQCVICYRPVPQHLFYSLTLSNGERHSACCAHCGISAHLMYGEQVQMAIATDYISGKPHSAQASFFLLGSAAEPCCHPSILSFEQEEMAMRFQKGFGGTLGKLAQAIAFLNENLSLKNAQGTGCPNCAKATVR